MANPARRVLDFEAFVVSSRRCGLGPQGLGGIAAVKIAEKMSEKMSEKVPKGSFSRAAERGWHRLLPVPFCYMGMGIFRVWTETLYANNQLQFPALVPPFSIPWLHIDGYAVFDFIAAAVLILLAVFARRIAPLYRHPLAIIATVVCMVGSACVNFGSLIAPELAPLLFWPSVVMGAVGIALILMLWSEFFGCINPMRTALYYSASVAVSCLILWVFKGLSFWWLWVGACVVPIVSLLCLWRAYATLPHDAYPPAYQGDFSFPWKPVAVMGVYSFVYGLRRGIFVGTLAMNSGVGAFLGSAAVYLLICASVAHNSPSTTAKGVAVEGAARSGRDGRDGQSGQDGQNDGELSHSFDFSILYKIAMPLMLASLVPIEGVLPHWQFVADTCALTCYTILLVLIMVILGNLSYRYGVCALWLFAIERAVRLVAPQVGRLAGEAMQTADLDPIWDALSIAVMAGLLVFVALMFFSEKNLSSSQWGVVLKNAVRIDGGGQASERNRLGVKCEEIGRQAKLTPREEEILLLVAQGKTVGQIARELYIGTNTVKTHTKHVYQKLGVHARNELLELLGVKEPQRGEAAGPMGPSGR